MERKSYTIHLGGRRYVLSSTDSQEHINRISNMVNNRVEEIGLMDDGVSFETAVAVCALTYADEIIKLQDDNARLRREQQNGRE